MEDPKKLLILTRWYVPGFQAGGLIRTMESLINNLAKRFDIYVLTTNTDFQSKIPYKGVKENQWLDKNTYKVKYLSTRQFRHNSIKESIQEVNPKYIYLKGFFDYHFNIYPLILQKLYKKNIKLFIAPSGMLMRTAMEHKTLKKLTYLSVFKTFNFSRKLTFHATSHQEKKAIEKRIGPDTKIKTIMAFPPSPTKNISSINKESTKISIIYISRIHPVKKNLAYLIRLLNKIKAKTTLSIAGPIEDTNYWDLCKKLIAKLPENITVNYLGKIPNNQVRQTIQNHHLFCLPTTGENYGYAIIEALAAARPVLISDQTPWRNLQQHKAGWDLPLNQPDLFIKAIEKLSNMTQEEFDQYCQEALNYAKSHINVEHLVEQYVEMFTS